MNTFDLGVADGIKLAGINLHKLKAAVRAARANPHKAGPLLPRLIGQAMDSPKTWAAGTALAGTAAVGARHALKKRKS